MGIELQLQIISVFMGVIGVALPALIAIVGLVYVRRINDRLDNLADDVDQLWDKYEELSSKLSGSSGDGPEPADE